MLSYVDVFSLTVASDSPRGNISYPQRLSTLISKRGRNIGVPFSFPKTELIYWRTLSQRLTHSKAAISFDGSLFHHSGVVKWCCY